MAKSNPAKAVAALLPVAIRGEGWEVRPLTLGIFAILERISSPLLEAGAKPQAMDLIPSLYVLTHDPMDSLTGDLFAKSVAWADTLPPRALAGIRAAVMRQVRVVTDVVPAEDDVKKKGTNGWLAILTQWAAEQYHWTWDETLWRCPASAIALWHRQWRRAQGDDKMMPLSTIEEIDNGSANA